MVDAQPHIPSKGADTIVPPGIAFFRLPELAKHINHSKSQQVAECGALFVTEQHRTLPQRRVMNVALLRCDIEVPEQGKPWVALELLAHIIAEPLEPGELVGIFLRTDFLTIGNIDVDDA